MMKGKSAHKSDLSGQFGLVEGLIAKHVVDNEYTTAQSNNQDMAESFQSFVDLLDAKRQDKDYDWMSDVRLPQFASIMLTQSSIDVSQYFMTRDFVECYIQDGSAQAKASADASKELINRTLNQRHLNHYLKFVRAKQIAHLNGCVYLVCWWEKVYNKATVEITPQESAELGGIDMENLEAEIETCTVDRFNYEVMDPRNVFASPEFTYGAQEKEWIIIRSQRTLQQIKDIAESEGYFNLDLLEGGGVLASDTDTAKDTDNIDGVYSSPDTDMSRSFDVLKRYGRFWAIVKDREPTLGVPVEIEPGIGEDGKPLEKAELIECIITFAVAGGNSILIGFHPTPYYDASGNAFKPIIRGQCYPHPVSDGGFGDGKHGRELQGAIDDTFNMTNDRTRLATIPVFKVRKYANEDNYTIFMEPGHKIELDDPVNDMQELVIRDNIEGGLRQLGMLVEGLQTLTSVFPTTMGSLPADSSTTATAIAGADQRSNQRSNFKSKTFEFTALTELYWMINHMTFAFAEKETGMKLMGDKVQNFDPRLDYFYKPLSQSIESDQSKQQKMQRWIQTLGFISNIQDPRVVQLFFTIIGEIAKLMGDEEAAVVGNALSAGQGQAPTPGGLGGPAQQPSMTQPMIAMSNQNGVPQSTQEMHTRELPKSMAGNG